MRQYHIIRQNGPDYYPLTTAEVIKLLDTAIALMDHKAFHPEETRAGIHSIAMRLGQGIPGKVSPANTDDPVVEPKLNKMYDTYFKWIKDPVTLLLKEQPLTEQSEIVTKLMDLMR